MRGPSGRRGAARPAPGTVSRAEDRASRARRRLLTLHQAGSSGASWEGECPAGQAGSRDV